MDTLGHIHLKDVVVDIARATLTCTPLGEGGMGPYLAQIAASARRRWLHWLDLAGSRCIVRRAAASRMASARRCVCFPQFFV